MQVIMKVNKKLPDMMWLLIIDFMTDGQVCPLSLGVIDKRRQFLVTDFRVNRRLTLRNPDLRGLCVKRLTSSLQRRSRVQELEIESPLHFSANDCLRLLSSCTFSSVWFHSNQASVKTDADIMREKLSQITETRNQLRGKAIVLAQEVVDLLKPDISIDYILDLDVSADLEVTSTGSNPLELCKLKSLAKRVLETKNLLVEHKNQLASLGLTAPLFCEAYRCCVNRRYNGSLLADSDATLRDEEARMLNIRPITGVAATHDHIEDLLTFSSSRLRYIEILGRTLASVLEQYGLLNSTVLSEEITPNELTPWVNRWSTIIKEIETLDKQLSKATTRKTIPDGHGGLQHLHQIRRRIGLLVGRNLMNDIVPPKGWSIFAKAINIARDVHSDLKKAQQLCKLNPKAFDSLYSRVENISAAPALRNSAAASAAPMPKHPRTPQGATTCRVIRQPSQHAYSAAASAAPTSKRPSIPKRETRRLTIGMVLRSKLIKNYKSACTHELLHK